MSLSCMGGSRGDSISRILATELIVFALLTLVLGGGQARASSSERATEQAAAETVFLKGQGNATTLSFVPQLPRDASFLSSSLNLETPTVPSQGPEQPSVQVQGGNRIWGWGGSFGWTGMPSGPWLTATNQTASTNFTLPQNLNLTSAQASILSGTRFLQGNYQLTMSIGGSQVFGRSGTEGFLPPQLLNWSANTASITSVAAGNLFNGSTLIAEGDAEGYLSVYAISPGENGTLLYHAPLSPPLTVSSVLVSSLPGSAYPAVIAICGTQMFISEENSLNEWGTNIYILPIPIGETAPTITSLTLVRYENGNPAVVVGATNREIYVSNWSSTGGPFGFQTPMQHLTTLAAVPTSLSSYPVSGQPALLSVGTLSSMVLFNLTSTGINPITTLYPPLGNGVTISSTLLAPNGDGLLAGSSNGYVYPYDQWNWSPTRPFQAGNAPIIGMSFDPLPGNDSIAISTTSDSVYFISNVFASSPEITKIGTVQSAAIIGPPTFGSVFGTAEQDILIPCQLILCGSVSTQLFNSTVLTHFPTYVKNAVSEASPKFDSDGNQIVQIPVSLSVTGGSASIWGLLVTYNWSMSRSISSLVEKSISTNQSISLDFTSSTPGVLHASVSITYALPMASTPILELEGALAFYWQDIAIAIVVAGSVLLGLGAVKYWRIMSKRPQPNVRI